jgi:chromosome transmission fidelity protein 1
MSEGINLANDMARCVLVVGLPYPDITDPEMQEKMKSLDRQFKENGGNGITGQSYYHNLCMRAVNQSVGRAIRHAKDYAAVVLADARYSSDPRIWRALPKWLRGDDTFQQRQGGREGFSKAMSGLRCFFQERRGD